MKPGWTERTIGKASFKVFVGIPYQVLDSSAFITLTPLARALYLDLRRQHNGRNNGDICTADGMLEPLGWPHSTIHKLLKELVEHGLIVKTRQGGIGILCKRPSLYAFTDLAIVSNPSKGIKGSMPDMSFLRFVPDAALRAGGKKNKKSMA